MKGGAKFPGRVKIPGVTLIDFEVIHEALLLLHDKIIAEEQG